MPRTLTGLAAVVVLLGFLGAFCPAAANWPMFQKNITHSGITAQDGAESDSTAWYCEILRPEGFPEDEVVWASPIINTMATKVYVATGFGRLYCFDLADGDSLWARDLPGGITATPAFSDDRLFVVAQGNRSLYCLDAADGDSLWAAELGSWWYYGTGREVWVESSPIVVGDSIAYVGSRDGTVYCLHTDDGALKWQSDTLGHYVTSTPAFYEHRIYVGATCWDPDKSGVYCLDEEDGDILWFYVYDKGNAGGTMGSPMIANGRMYIGTNENTASPPYHNGGHLCYFSLPQTEDGGPVGPPTWKYGIECDVRGTPVWVNNRVYVTSGRGMYAFDTVTDSLVLGQDHGMGIILGPV